jgi:hypothetical protein
MSFTSVTGKSVSRRLRSSACALLGPVAACTLATDEFVRRFLIHILPHGFHRVRHYGLFANGNRAANIARAREVKHAMKAEARKIA